MRIERLGESAFILRELPHEPWELAEALSSADIPGVEEASASYDTVGLFVDPTTFEVHLLETEIDSFRQHAGRVPGLHEIPVCYEMGLDLEEAAERLKLEPAQLIELHSSVTYTCYAVGFMPGFPYLGYLPGQISGLARLDQPRAVVPRGSVGITGRQTGIYPSESPGGWWLIGRTPLKIVDLDLPFFRLKAGDEVRFIPIDELRFRELAELA